MTAGVDVLEAATAFPLKFIEVEITGHPGQAEALGVERMGYFDQGLQIILREATPQHNTTPLLARHIPTEGVLQEYAKFKESVG
ncbi:hypothetical protein TNCT_80291 [Trichonephila clavata]|uniref:Uncharacterized protein n=1 Tax=Trichonephila clavata TaxID=2740835 RepID=A0A8X6G058_TRICU|nr:hypothetical protein TNCT_80291 [Trichonephila clavata]